MTIMLFKVMQSHDFGTNRKPICNFLLVINTNLHVPPILHRFQVMADYWSNFHYRWRGATGGDPLRISDKLYLSRN